MLSKGNECFTPKEQKLSYFNSESQKNDIKDPKKVLLSRNLLKINTLTDGIFYEISCAEAVWNFPANDMSATSNIRVKSKLTEKIIEMHKKGYEYDFKVEDGPHIICLQDNVPFQNERVQICVIAQCFDSIAKQFKYIHTIETTCGRKGLLLDDRLFTSPQSNSYFIPKF